MDKRINRENYSPFVEIIDMNYNFPLKIRFGKGDYLEAFVSHPSQHRSTLIMGKSEEHAKGLHKLDLNLSIQLRYTSIDYVENILTTNVDTLFRIIGKDFVSRKNLTRKVNSVEKLFSTIENGFD